MAGQKEKIKEPTTPKDPYWKQVRSTKKDPGPTIGEIAFGAYKAMANVGAWILGQKPVTTSTTTVRGAIRRKHTY